MRSDRRLHAADWVIPGDQAGNRWLAACRLSDSFNLRFRRFAAGVERVLYNGRPALVVSRAWVLEDQALVEIVEEGDQGTQVVRCDALTVAELNPRRVTW